MGLTGWVTHTCFLATSFGNTAVHPVQHLKVSRKEDVGCSGWKQVARMISRHASFLQTQQIEPSPQMLTEQR